MEGVNISKPIFQMRSEGSGRFYGEQPTVNNTREVTSSLGSAFSPILILQGRHPRWLGCGFIFSSLAHSFQKQKAWTEHLPQLPASQVISWRKVRNDLPGSGRLNESIVENMFPSFFFLL